MWRGKQHPHSQGRPVAALCCFNYCSSANVPGHGGERAAGTGGNVACGCSQPAEPWLLCCAEAWTGLVLGQGKHPPQAPPKLPTDLDGLFLPTVQAAPCPPQLTVTHFTPLIFTVVSTLKENSLLRRTLSGALLLCKAVFPLARSTRVVPRGHVGVSSSFWPLPEVAGRPPPARGEVLQPDTGSSSLLLLPPINASLP